MTVREFLPLIIDYYEKGIKAYLSTKRYTTLMDLELTNGMCFVSDRIFNVYLYDSKLVNEYGRKMTNTDGLYLFPFCWPTHSLETNVECLQKRLDFLKNALNGVGYPDLEEEL